MRFTALLSFGLAAHALPSRHWENMSPRAEEVEDPNKIDQKAKFDTDIVLQGGNIQQDTTFPPGQNGVLEIEFANADGRTLKVTENKTPAAPPSGFTALESSSYKVALSGGSADGLTVSKVDYIRNSNSTLDISKGQIGRLCTETNTFVVDPSVGELEFEAEENELSLKVKNMNAEWGIFLPNAAGAAGGAKAKSTTAGKAATGDASGTATTGTTLMDFLTTLFGRARAG